MSTTFQSDWNDREFIQNTQYNIMQIKEFLNKLDKDVRGKLAALNHRLTNLERKMEYMEESLRGFNQRAEEEL